MIFNRCMGLDPSGLPPIFTCTGTEGTDYRYALDAETGNWELAILNSCSIRFTRVGNVDLFLVGGGYAGGTGTSDSTSAHAGSGGAGGKKFTKTGVTLTTGQDYPISIGESSGGTTSGFGFSSVDTGCVNGSAGGGGAVSHDDPQYRSNAFNGVEGAYAFGESASLLYPGRKYAAGGGGGGATKSGSRARGLGGDGGSYAGEPYPKGGDGSGGNGGNGGAGGHGGGGGGTSGYGNYVGGAGGKGILIIRNARGGGT